MKNTITVLSLLLFICCFTQCKSDDDNDVSCICPENFDPVCGEDGQLYSNECFAQCVGVNFTAGFCEVEQNGLVVDLGDPALDGCGWALELVMDDTVIPFRPDSISNEFLIDKLEVSVKYRQTLISEPCGLIETIPVIEIIEIKQR